MTKQNKKSTKRNAQSPYLRGKRTKTIKNTGKLDPFDLRTASLVTHNRRDQLHGNDLNYVPMCPDLETLDIAPALRDDGAAARHPDVNEAEMLKIVGLPVSEKIGFDDDEDEYRSSDDDLDAEQELNFG